MDTQPIIELFSLCKRWPSWSVNVYSTVHYLANISRNSSHLINCKSEWTIKQKKISWTKKLKGCGNVWGIPIWVLVLPAVSWFVIYYFCQAEEMILIGDKNGDGKIEYEGKKLQLLQTC